MSHLETCDKFMVKFQSFENGEQKFVLGIHTNICPDRGSNPGPQASQSGSLSAFL